MMTQEAVLPRSSLNIRNNSSDLRVVCVLEHRSARRKPRRRLSFCSAPEKQKSEAHMNEVQDPPSCPPLPSPRPSDPQDASRRSVEKEENEKTSSWSAWASYRRAIKEKPVATKAVTAAAVSALGELLGSAIKTRLSPPPPGTPAPGSRGLLSYEGRGAGTRDGPGLVRRTAAFAIFGLILNGPVFHWWYDALERAAARLRKPGECPGGARDIAFKLAMDRLVITPPYLMLTLASLRLLQGLGLERSMRESRQLYMGALVKNWKVWTLAQLINFKLVPIEFRPLFGNFVACWWNIYLSLLSTEK